MASDPAAAKTPGPGGYGNASASSPVAGGLLFALGNLLHPLEHDEAAFDYPFIAPEVGFQMIQRLEAGAYGKVGGMLPREAGALLGGDRARGDPTGAADTGRAAGSGRRHRDHRRHDRLRRHRRRPRLAGAGGVTKDAATVPRSAGRHPAGAVRPHRPVITTLVLSCRRPCHGEVASCRSEALTGSR